MGRRTEAVSLGQSPHSSVEVQPNEATALSMNSFQGHAPGADDGDSLGRFFTENWGVRVGLARL